MREEEEQIKNKNNFFNRLFVVSEMREFFRQVGVFYFQVNFQSELCCSIIDYCCYC